MFAQDGCRIISHDLQIEFSLSEHKLYAIDKVKIEINDNGQCWFISNENISVEGVKLPRIAKVGLTKLI